MLMEETKDNTIKAQDVYRNACVVAEYRLGKSRWEMPQRMFKSVRTKILWDFHIPTGKQILTKLTGHCGNTEGTEEQVVTEVEVPCESSIKGKEYERI